MPDPTPMSGGTDATANALRQGLNQQIGALTKLLSAVLAAVQSTAGTASAGGAALPNAPAGFLNITLPNGQPAKVPFYNP